MCFEGLSSFIVGLLWFVSNSRGGEREKGKMGGENREQANTQGSKDEEEDRE